VATRGRLHLHVGGAVVADSDPTLEWRETMHKAARLLEAAGGAAQDRTRPAPAVALAS
jgi:anthranilate/para-aminobenzoate synthase component I